MNTKKHNILAEYRFILEPYKGLNTRYDCPSCGQRKIFVRYIDTETGKHLAINVGKCNRESNCGYHFTPKQYFQDNGYLLEGLKILSDKQLIKATPPTKAISYISIEPFKNSLCRYEVNNFVSYLIKLFGADTAFQLIQKYCIGTSRHWQGATVFWQIDKYNRIHTGKIMLYNAETGKRVKHPFPHITWVHKALHFKNYNLLQCFFGEHLLLNEPVKPIAIVESEKTAIIASVYLPDFIWLAVGSINNLSHERCIVLQGRNIVLYPDLNAFEKWQQKANELSGDAIIKVSDLLERKADVAEKEQGLDIADYLIKYDCRKFQ